MARRNIRFDQVMTRTSHGNAYSEPFDVTDGMLQQCCDCGLVHRWTFTRKGKRIEAAVRVHQALTRKARRKAR